MKNIQMKSIEMNIIGIKITEMKILNEWKVYEWTVYELEKVEHEKQSLIFLKKWNGKYTEPNKKEGLLESNCAWSNGNQGYNYIIMQ